VVSSDKMVQDATARWNNSYEGLKQALTIQSAIVSHAGSEQPDASHRPLAQAGRANANQPGRGRITGVRKC